MKRDIPPTIRRHFEPTELEIAASKKAALDAEKKANVARILNAAAIPPRFANRHFDNYKTENESQVAILNSAKTYAETFRQRLAAGDSLTMLGSPGTGKTHLAVAIAHAVVEQGFTAVFTSVIKAARRVKECYRQGAIETEAKVIKSFAQPDLLILDEVGVQFGSETEKMIVFEIINTRYENLKPTILISNEDEIGLKKYIGERVFDRMLEGAGGVLTFNWGSYRRGGK